MSDMKIEYQVVSLHDVMTYFAKGFEMRDGRSLFAFDHFIDPVKGKVVFCLTTMDGAG